MKEHFTGDRKQLNHFLLAYEKKIIKAGLPLVPLWMSTVHLTLMAILWCGLIVLFSYLARWNIHWLWGVSICVFLQHITDMLDGEVGRQRNTGLVKWGFYMDHFLDYIFLCAILGGYSFLLPLSYSPLILINLMISSCFMVHVLLDFAITGDYKISVKRFGVSELRYAVIFLNTLLIFKGQEILRQIMPVVTVISLLILLIVIFESQKNYRRIDMDALQEKDKRVE